jgi:hypothetical protein
LPGCNISSNGTIAVASNQTKGWSRAVVDVGVAYDTDVDRAIEILRDEAALFGNDQLWASRLDGFAQAFPVGPSTPRRYGCRAKPPPARPASRAPIPSAWPGHRRWT